MLFREVRIADSIVLRNLRARGKGTAKVSLLLLSAYTRKQPQNALHQLTCFGGRDMGCMRMPTGFALSTYARLMYVCGKCRWSSGAADFEFHVLQVGGGGVGASDKAIVKEGEREKRERERACVYVCVCVCVRARACVCESTNA